MKLLKRFGILFLVVVPMAVFYQNCQQHSSATGSLNNQSASAVSTVTKTKYLYVIDQSSYNQQNYIWSGPSATAVIDPAGGNDPSGKYRYGPLIKFLNSGSQPANTSYAVIFFGSLVTLGAGERSQSIWTHLTNNVPTENSPSFVSQILTAIACPNGNCSAPTGDGGYADYQQTLSQISTSIVQDVAYEQSLVTLGQGPITSSDYKIIWISGSYPCNTFEQENFTLLLTELQTIIDIKYQSGVSPYINSITLSAQFYSSTTTLAWSQSQIQTLLQDMAAVGQGSFTDLNQSSGNFN
jgi:hypothetical protein